MCSEPDGGGGGGRHNYNRVMTLVLKMDKHMVGDSVAQTPFLVMILFA